MALLKFKSGQFANLPTERAEGTIYITSDSEQMYVDLATGRVRIGDLIIVENQASLEALGTYYVDKLYYIKDSNVLKKYFSENLSADGEEENHWKVIGDTDTLEATLATFGGRLVIAEGKIETLEGQVASLNTGLGQINASSVDTTNKIIVTRAVGNYSVGHEIDADTDLQTLLTNMLSQDVNPTTTQPTMSIALTGAGAKEVGSSFTPSYTINHTDGGYNANGVSQASGVTFSGYSATEVGRPEGNNTTKTTKTGTFDSFIVTDTTNYKISGYCAHSDGNMPKTYLGADYPSGQIKAKTFSAANTGNVTGYRAWFHGYKNGTQAIDDPTAITSEQIRALTSRNGSWTNSLTTNKMKQMYFAAPASAVAGKKVTVANATNGAPQTVFGPISVQVEGKDHYTAIEYKVWYINNAAEESGQTTFTIALVNA